MNRKIRLRGIAEDTSDVSSFKAVATRSKGRVRLGVSRDAAATVDLSEVQHDDIACLEFSNGFKLWIQVVDLCRENAVNTSRGLGDGDDNVWEIDPQLSIKSTERGVAGLAVEALEIFGVDLKGVAASKLSEWFEVKQLQAEGEGLYQFSHLTEELKLIRVVDQKVKAKASPSLLFIHGTGSSSVGGFKKLWEDAKDAGIATRKALQDFYGDGCYAFEHRSLTVSPIANALAIAQTLPKNAELHLVTHSRGGLVGELLCLGQRETAPDPLQQDWLQQIFDPQLDRSQGELMGLGLNQETSVDRVSEYTEQQAQLFQLITLLDAKNIKITRFVRVACPARGTTLASGRLDRWLSVVQFLSGGNDLVEFLLAVVKQRTDPRTLPGIASMMPGSPLIALLNDPRLEVSADLSVIAGDVEGDSLWNKLKLQLLDWFYDSEHDLVVNTGSMYGGLRRRQGSARFYFDQGNNVNHFNYFANRHTVEKLTQGLLRSDSESAGFNAIDQAKHEAPKRSITARSARTSGPLVVVLHGTLGSHLFQDEDKVWLNIPALVRGKLAELGITMPNVVSQGLLDDFYGDFIDYLGTSHRVEPFHYDWRLSVQDSAERLAERLLTHLPDCEAKRQPLRFIAHSMGGLVVRAMFSLYPDIWRRFQALPGSRFVMLGTPNAGSYEAVRWLTGWNPTLGKLSWLDVTHDTAGLVNIVNRFPGLLELLPSDTEQDFSKPELWQQICKGGDKKWPLPQADTLKKLNKTWQLIRQSPIDSERMIYVAGWAPQTVSGVESMAGRGFFSKQRPPVRFYANKKGDGTVPWALGRLPGVTTWYVEDAAHDQLMAHTPAFPAYVDLLQSGTTSRLPQQEPANSRSEGVERHYVREQMPDSLPSAEDLSGFVFGMERPKRQLKQRRLPRVNVSIRHGNLAYACYPVCVGHYFGDTIVSAESALDFRLEGALRKRLALGLYPGLLGSHEVFIHRQQNSQPNGAIVVGLGLVGELSPGALTSGIASALLDYALKISEWPDDRFGACGTVRSAKVSFLLIGTGFGGMDMRDSVDAILNGVKTANDRLVAAQFDDRVLIDEIEVLEIYQDLAIKAARELQAILTDDVLQQYFQCSDFTLKTGAGGQQRVVFDPNQNWWHRLEIVFDKQQQILRFIALTDRARAEVSLVSGQMHLANQFIADMISTTDNSRQAARTLFEMLMPNQLKELAPQQHDLVLIVDQASARYPWELLDDRWSSKQEPPAIAAGLLRQLKTLNFRSKPLHSAEKSAFVIGNPLIESGSEGSIFPDLPGAAKEADAVAGLLAGFGYDVNRPLGRKQTDLNAREILTGLHGDAYRILHLAGHGVHEFDTEKYHSVSQSCTVCGQDTPVKKKLVSGMVIGENTFLTPGDVEQMRWVPELVFINCCHLGSTAVRYPEAKRYNDLAANLGIQFINMGVKAVVAAGWAVDDAAAKAFAETFYQAMLSGRSFGLAIQQARKHIYQQYPDVNTWGAYQCYGDPDFRLREDGSKVKRSLPQYHAKAEWVADLNNIVSALHSHRCEDEESERWLQWIKDCENRVPTDQLSHWQSQADVMAALGALYGEMEDYETAIHYLDQALSANKADLPVKALEQRANYQVKCAIQFRNSRDKTQIDQSKKTVASAIDVLTQLNRLGPTIERFALLGSASKRLAWLQTGKKSRMDALQDMRDYYRQAFELGYSENKPDAYPLSNWVTAAVVLNWLGRPQEQSWQTTLPELTNQIVNDAKLKLAKNPDYWASLVEPDCVLMKALVKNTFSDEACKDIGEGYRLAVERGASHKDKHALCEHIEFLMAMAKLARKKEIWKSLQSILTIAGLHGANE
jgi:CHAT domain-containing protein/pimeloyl-ACP methyl ester carboxylesterase